MPYRGVSSPSRRPTEATLLEHCRDTLAAFKAPADIVMIDAIPPTRKARSRSECAGRALRTAPQYVVVESGRIFPRALRCAWHVTCSRDRFTIRCRRFTKVSGTLFLVVLDQS